MKKPESASHTVGPWRQGVFLDLPAYARAGDDWKAAQRRRESLSVFSNFHIEDHGKSRFLVATTRRPEDAVLIAAAPELRERLAELVKQMYALATDECKEWRDAEALLTRLRDEGV